MKFLRNRKVLAAISLMVALVICFILAPKYQASIEAKTEVVRVKEKIKKGDRIEEKNIEVVEVGGYNLPTNIVKDKALVVGKYAKADLYKEENIIKEKISEEELDNDVSLRQLDPGTKAISLTLKSLAAGVSEKLKPGDIVSVVVTQYGDSAVTVQPTELQFVEVLAVTTATGNEKTDKKSSDTDENNLSSTVTVKANSQQVLKLADIEANGVAHLAFVYRGKDKDTYLNKQNEILNK